MDIAPVNSNTAKVMTQEGVDAGAQISDESIRNATQAVAPLLRNSNVSVSATSDSDDSTRDIGMPELDEALTGSDEDLEKLIALLTLESDEEQIKAAKERLQALLDSLDTEQKKVLEQLSEALEEAKKVEAQQKKQAALGWIMLGLAILATVITSVATFGAAAPGAAAIIGCVFSIAGTVISATNQILTATGAKEDFVNRKTEELMKENPGMSKAEAKKKAEKEWTIIFGVLQGVCAVGALACGIASMAQSVKSVAKAGADVAKEVAKESAKAGGKLAQQNVQLALKITGASVQLASSAVGVGQAVLSYKIAELVKEQQLLAAEMAKIQKFIDLLNQMLEEEQEMVQELLENMQLSLSVLMTMINSETDAVTDMLLSFNTGNAV